MSNGPYGGAADASARTLTSPATWLDTEKSRTAADRLGLPQAYDRFEQVLRDTTVQAVHINTPNRWHRTMAADACERGKHVPTKSRWQWIFDRVRCD